MEEINIQAFMENTFISFTDISNTHNIEIDKNFVDLIEKDFSEEHKKIFLMHLLCYSRYNIFKDFIVNLRTNFKYLGYPRIDGCKNLLIKNFKENEDYIIKKSSNGKKDIYLLTIYCYKLLFLKADTEEADKMRNYFVDIENATLKYLLQTKRE